MIFRALGAACLALSLAVFTPGLGGPPAVRAETEIALTPALQNHLMGLKPLRGPSVDRALFDGRPVLVAFFASW